MNHKTLDVKATATDLGEFTAIAAAYSVDRVGDRIIPGAFKGTIERWQASGKQIPLHWNHQGEPEDIIGTIDPSSMEETDLGLKVAGKLDLENPKAKDAWRAIKSDSMSLSFGYMVLEEAKAKDGVNDLKEIDLFEVSVVPGPANADTRFLSLKSVSDMKPEELRNELSTLRKRLDEIESALEEQPPANGQDAPDEEPEGPTPKASDPEAVIADIECIEALT